MIYVETPREQPGRIHPEDFVALQENIHFAQDLGAKVVKLKGNSVADELIAFCMAPRNYARCFWSDFQISVGHPAARLNYQSLSG